MNPSQGDTTPSEPPVPETSAKPGKPRKWLRVLGKIVGFLLIATLGLVACVAGMLYGGYVYFSQGLPSLDKLKDYNPPTVTQLYADNGVLIAEFAAERRFVVPLDQIPQMLQSAFISVEDRNFWVHGGTNSSALNYFVTRRRHHSTISAQVAKTFLLTAGRKYPRKIKEALLCGLIERSFPKDYILFLYLNSIYLGSGVYGVEAASRTYFDKSVKDLTIAECAMLAGLPKAPSSYSPKNNLKRALERRSYVLTRMLEDGYISEAQYEEAMKEEPRISSGSSVAQRPTPDFIEHVRKYVENKYGQEALLKEGLQVYTTVDLNLTEAARTALDAERRELDKRQGYRGSPIYVKKIVDRHGKVLEENLAPGMPDDSIPSGQSRAVKAISSETASAMTGVLQRVIQEGTGTTIKGIFDRPDIAGKTGTTNECVDSWFLGFSPDYTGGVWVGFDDEKSLGEGETGARVAAPIWAGFMREALKGTPVKESPISPGAQQPIESR